MLLQCPRLAMRQALLLLCMLAIVCGQKVGEDGYTDENRPYEFGFNIEGYQHRHEMKDENGIIMGEFGFITADGIYHVTVYATDENGDFKILKMKNIRVGFPPGTPLMPAARDDASKGRGFAPNNAPLPKSTTIRTPTSTVNPKFTVASGCGSCKVPITTTRKPQIAPSRPPSFAARGMLSPAGFPRAETPEKPDAGNQGNEQPPAGGIFGQIPGSNVIGQVPGFGSLPNGNVPFVPSNGTIPFVPSNGNVPFVPSNGNVPFVPSNGNVPFVPSNGTIPFVPSNGNVPFVPNPGSDIFGTGQNNQTSGGIPFGQVPGTDLLGQIPGGGAVFGGSPPSNQSSDTPITGQFPGTNGFGGVLPTNSSAGFPTGSIPPITGISGALPGVENPSFPSPIPGGVFGDVPIEPDSGKPPVGVEQPGLPNGITENDIKDLLYRFNYTAGYHGHHESGYRNGNKEGGYFANGRDGVGQRVKYLANQFGYQPNISFVELSAADTPKEETEKSAGLKGYAFEWFYRKRR